MQSLDTEDMLACQPHTMFPPTVNSSHHSHMPIHTRSSANPCLGSESQAGARTTQIKASSSRERRKRETQSKKVQSLYQAQPSPRVLAALGRAPPWRWHTRSSS